MQERTYCPQCQTFRFKPVGERCFHCAQVPTETGAASAVTPASISCAESARKVEPVTFGGATIDAPGFDQEGFEKAMCRAFVDELVIVQDQTGQDVVCYAGTNGGYRTTRTSCDCPAGVHGRSCKHRAFYCFHLDVREPALRRQWASARELVAA